MAQQKQGRTMMLHAVLGDCHFGAGVNMLAWNWALYRITQERPTVVVQCGDLVDLGTLSKHARAPGAVEKAIKELSPAKVGWKNLEDATWRARYTARIVWTPGNHDVRLLKWVAANAPALEGLVPSMRDVLGMSKRVLSAPYQIPVRVDGITYVHDAGYAGAGSLGQMLSAFPGQRVCYGHTHRAGILYGRGKSWAANVGWLGNTNKLLARTPYISRAQAGAWRNGMLWVRDGVPTFEPYPGT
jgi:predicted phosphodiesterase